jgi:predicted  nucleic acid-binding Zn-ribbon protein
MTEPGIHGVMSESEERESESEERELNGTARHLEHEADELEERKEKLGDDIDERRKEWERKHVDDDDQTAEGDAAG